LAVLLDDGSPMQTGNLVLLSSSLKTMQ